MRASTAYTTDDIEFKWSGKPTNRYNPSLTWGELLLIPNSEQVH